MLRNKKYTISDCYSTKISVFMMLEMTTSYLSGIETYKPIRLIFSALIFYGTFTVRSVRNTVSVR